MASYELSSALTVSLIDVVKTGLIQSTHVPPTHLNSLLNEFFKSGRRIANMKVDSQILMMTMLAMTARFTNHSAIVGQSRSIDLAGNSIVRPDVKQAMAVDAASPNFRANALAVLGSYRQEACFKLTQAARKLVERTTVTLSQPSMTIIMAMLNLSCLEAVPRDLDASKSGTGQTRSL